MRLSTILIEVLNEVSIDQLKTQFVNTGKIDQKDFDEIKNLCLTSTTYSNF